MANDIKSGVGFIIPAAGVVGFFTSLLLGEYMLSIIIAVLGILIWFIYMLVMESHMPHEMGNMIMLFGVLLSLGIFFSFGITLKIVINRPIAINAISAACNSCKFNPVLSNIPIKLE